MFNKKLTSQKITVIGGGVAGCCTALHLAEIGHKVVLIDPQANNKFKKDSLERNGSQASLGILMGYVYRRSKGRSWLLRKRSMELWPQILNQINTREESIKIHTPLVQLAKSEEELNSMKKLIEEKNHFGIELLNKEKIKYFSDVLNKNQYGGLISYKDGRVNPIKLIKLLINAFEKYQIEMMKTKVISLKRNGSQWHIYLENKQMIEQNMIIICTALGSIELVKPLGHKLNLEPILGQVLDLEYLEKDFISFEEWPSVLSIENFNLILKKENRLLIGATLEPGFIANSDLRNNMHTMNDNAPNWIKNASIKNEWSGIRAKPIGESSPILKTLEPGLIVNTGHYRNGVLLAPACAEWVGSEINKNLIEVLPNKPI